MSDFLTNLAVRSAGSADAIQPRLASLFEPTQTVFGSIAAPSFFPQELQQETFEEATSQGNAHETVAHDRINRLPAFGPSLVEVPRAELKAEAKPASKLPAPDPLKPKRPPMPTRGATPLDPVAAHPLPRFPASELGSSSSVSSQLLVPEPVASVLPIRSGQEIGEGMPQSRATYSYKAAIGPHARAAESKSSLTDDQVRSGRLTTPRIEFSYLPPNYFSQSARSIIEPRVTPRSAEARRGAASSQFKPTEPTIQVTIGRIEVRAVPQQAPARPVRSASPVMSLDEYLRRREKRGGE